MTDAANADEVCDVCGKPGSYSTVSECRHVLRSSRKPSEDRLEAIRQVEEEIQILDEAIAFAGSKYSAIFKRILDARKAVLADLRRGMREGD